MKSVKEKSRMLAELMGWNPYGIHDNAYYMVSFMGNIVRAEPYLGTKKGLAQFAAILLKFPEVMMEWSYIHTDGIGWIDGADKSCGKPTQANILDEILRMEGKL